MVKISDSDFFQLSISERGVIRVNLELCIFLHFGAENVTCNS